MDKREALEICLKVYRECMENEDCFNCPFGEYYKGIRFCILSQIDIFPLCYLCIFYSSFFNQKGFCPFLELSTLLT